MIFKHIIYEIYRLILGIIMFIPIHFVRLIFIKCILKSCGKKCYFSRNIDIRSPRHICIGKNVIINKNVILDGRGATLTIGNNVDIAQDVNIWTEEHDVQSIDHCLKSANVKINDNVWIATRATILPGITVGEGAVVACNAVVTKDVEPYTIVAGIPAKKIGVRNQNLKYELSSTNFLI